MTYATPPMQGTPMPAPPVQQMRPNAYRLPTNRSLTKFILLGLITFGIYDIVIMTTTAEALNTIASPRDGKKTMNYCLMYFLIGWLTLGIGWLVWFHNFSDRIGEEQRRRGMVPTVTASTFWLWEVLGSLIVVGPFIYHYKMLHAMNDLCASYNAYGICPLIEADWVWARIPRPFLAIGDRLSVSFGGSVALSAG